MQSAFSIRSFFDTKRCVTKSFTIKSFGDLFGILGADIADIHSIRRYRMNLVQLA